MVYPKPPISFMFAFDFGFLFVGFYILLFWGFEVVRSREAEVKR